MAGPTSRASELARSLLETFRDRPLRLSGRSGAGARSRQYGPATSATVAAAALRSIAEAASGAEQAASGAPSGCGEPVQRDVSSCFGRIARKGSKRPKESGAHISRSVQRQQNLLGFAGADCAIRGSLSVVLASIAAEVSARSHARDLPGTVDLVLAASELAAAVPRAVDTAQVRCLARALAQSAERAIRSEGEARGRLHRRATLADPTGADSDTHQVEMAVLDAAQAELVSTLAAPAAIAVLEFVVTHTESPELLAAWNVIDIPLQSAEVIGSNPHALASELLQAASLRAAPPKAESPAPNPAATPEPRRRSGTRSHAESPGRHIDSSWSPESAVTASPSSLLSEGRREALDKVNRGLCICEPRLGLVAIATAAMLLASSDVARLAGWVALETSAATLELRLARAGWAPSTSHAERHCAASRMEFRETALAITASASLQVSRLIVSWLGRASAAPRPSPRAVMVIRSIQAGSILATIASGFADHRQEAATTGVLAQQTPGCAAADTAKFPARLPRPAAISLGIPTDHSSSGDWEALHDGYAASGVGSVSPLLAASRAGLMVRCFLASASPGTAASSDSCCVAEVVTERLLATVVSVVQELLGIDGAGLLRQRGSKKGRASPRSVGSCDEAGIVAGAAAECARQLGSAISALSLVRACVSGPSGEHTIADPFEGRSPETVSSALSCGADAASLWSKPLPHRCRLLAQTLVSAAMGRTAGGSCVGADLGWKDLAAQVGVADASAASNALQLRSALLRGASQLLRGRAKRKHSRWRQALYAGLACALPQDAWLQQAESEWIASESAVDGRAMLATLTALVGRPQQGGPAHGHTAAPCPRSSLEAATSVLRFAAEQDSSSAVRLRAVVAFRALLSPDHCPVVQWHVASSLLVRLFDDPAVAACAADAMGSCLGGLAGVAALALGVASQHVVVSPSAGELLPAELKGAVAVARQNVGSAQLVQVLGALVVIAEEAAAAHSKSAAEGASEAADACRQLGKSLGGCAPGHGHLLPACSPATRFPLSLARDSCHLPSRTPLDFPPRSLGRSSHCGLRSCIDLARSLRLRLRVGQGLRASCGPREQAVAQAWPAQCLRGYGRAAWPGTQASARSRS